VEVCSAAQAKPVGSANYLVKMSSQALAAGLSSFGSSIGQGFQNYMAGREKRELLSGEAMAIYNELGRKGVRTQDEQKMFDKLEKAGDMGTRELQSIISEYETGEKMEQLQRTKRLQDLQIRNAERKEKSELDLMRFGKSIPEMESEFTGPEYGTVFDTSEVEANLAKDPAFYSTIDSEYLAGNMVNKEVPMPPAPPLYADQAEEIATQPDVGEIWAAHGLDPKNPFHQDLMKRGESGYKKRTRAAHAEIIRNLGATKRRLGDPDEYEANRDDRIRLSENPTAKELQDKIVNLTEQAEDIVARNPWLTQDIGTTNLPAQRVDTPETATLDVGEGRSFRNVPAYLLDQDARQAGDPRVKPYEPQAPQDQGPSMEMYGDIDKRTAMLDEGDTHEERRAKLVNALADYDLAPADRQQAIAMINERYPKLTQMATEVVTSGGEKLGYNVGGSFVRSYKKGEAKVPQGWRVKTRTVDPQTGLETLTFENPKNLPTYVPTASSIAEQDGDLALKNENAPSEGQAKEFNTAVVSAKGIVEDARYLIDMTKDASFFQQRLLDREFKAKVSERIAMMKGQMRLLIVGPGAMSEMEQKMLADALPNPADFFRLDSATIARLEGLEYLSNRKLKFHGEAIGLWDYNSKQADKNTESNAADPAGIGI